MILCEIFDLIYIFYLFYRPIHIKNGTKFVFIGHKKIVTVNINCECYDASSTKGLSASLPGAILALLIIPVNAVQNNVSSNGAVSEIICHVHINTSEQRSEACNDPTKKYVDLLLKSFRTHL